MKSSLEKTIEIPASIEEFETAREFVEGHLENRAVSKEIASETAIVFETLFDMILIQGFTDTMLSIASHSSFGETEFKIGFEGKRFDPTKGFDDGFSPEVQILKAFKDKIDCKYRSGYNVIRIRVKRNARRFTLECTVGIVLAIFAYLITDKFINVDIRTEFFEGYLLPLEQMFTDAVLMVGAPVTLFSLLKNLTDSFIVAERNSSVRRMQAKTVITSIVAIVLALALSFVLSIILSGIEGRPSLYADTTLSWSFAEVITQIVPSSILEPFVAISPFPIIIISLIVTYALCSVGKYFDVFKTAIDACYELFSRMLHFVMTFLPVFSFLAFLDILYYNGFASLLDVVLCICAIALCVVVLLVTYMIRLKACNVNLREFAKKLLPLLRENYHIGSAIEAVPFNIRYCAKYFGMNRERLNNNWPILSQVNLDGNCFLIMLSTAIYIIASGVDVSVESLFMIAVVVLFLSFGAPNQPGSILIGMLIIINYLNAFDMLSMAIYLEVFLSSLQNNVNVMGDLVILVEEERRSERMASEQ